MTLKQLSINIQLKKCETSGYARRMAEMGNVPMLSDKSEKDLAESITKYNQLYKTGMFWRTPNKSSKIGEKDTLDQSASTMDIVSGIGKKLDPKPVYGYSSGRNGMSDMVGGIIVNGSMILVALEIKIPGDTWKKKQKEFCNELQDIGGIYVIVTCWDDYFQKVEVDLRGKITRSFAELVEKYYKL